MSDKQEKQYVNKAGKYLCVVKDPGQGWIDSTKSGTPYVRIPLLIEDETSDQHGREIVWNGYFSEKAAGRTMDVLGDLFGNDWTDDDLYLGRVKWAGTKARVTVEEEEYEGKTRFKARWLNPARGNVKPETVEKIKQAIKARMAKVEEPKVESVEADDIQF